MCQAILKQHGAFLQLQDNRFRLEHLIEVGGDKKFKLAALSLLPSPGKVSAMGVARDGIEKLMQSVVFRFANPSLQVAGTAGLDQMRALVEKRALSRPVEEHPFLAQCKAAMGAWYSFGLGEEEHHAPGQASALAAYAHFEKEVAASANVSYSALQ